MASSPEVTVVVPTRNRATILSGTLAGALRQEDVELEVVVVDDGSTDETPSLLAAVDDQRLRVLRHETSRGVARARNRGIAEARGEWIAFLDDDDLWSPRKLRVQLDAALAQDADFSYTGGVAVSAHKRVYAVLPPPSPADLHAQLLRWNVVGGPSTVAARTRLFDRCGPFDGRLAVLADWELWMRLAEVGRPAAAQDILVAYVDHGSNMQIADAAVVNAELDYVEAKHRRARETRGVDLDRRTFWRWVALNHVRAGRRLDAARLMLDGAVRYRSPGNLVRAGRALVGPTGLRRAWVNRTAADLPEPAWLQSYR